MVDHLDLSAITVRYTGEERGYPPYHSVMMVKVLLYACCVGVPSLRKIAKRLEEDIAFRILAANNTPDFRTISDFRKDHLEALSSLFLQVLKLCQKARWQWMRKKTGGIGRTRVAMICPKNWPSGKAG